MKLKCLGSGSSGNCYLLTADNGETLLLDAGLPIMDIKRGLNWDVKCVVGAICTHAHKDHSLSVSDLEHMDCLKPETDRLRLLDAIEPDACYVVSGVILKSREKDALNG